MKTAENFKQYQRKQIAELRPYQEGEDLSERVSISQADRENGSPKVGDMIARNPKNHNDQWLVAKQYFDDNFETMESYATQSKWISVEDKMPEDNVKVLVIDRNGILSILWFNSFWYCADWDIYCDNYRFITHWQPLPPPPSETTKN